MLPESLQLLKTVSISAREIIFIESDINYSVFHLNNGKCFTIAKTLKKIQDITQNHDFVRINRRYLVNLAYVEREAWNSNANYVSLINGMSLYYSRRRLTHSREKIMSYLLF
ncbi:LytTR family DNA-binding domain-containing protein [Emticicia sp. BO119]|uniref:LytR/AlgR family response regulator transcription factor n=1 Tax=Emticicia sp. BO119 TaxID=2757768 RepID=UPI0015F0B699|nr:LytTR family DNA-binding domain-containing protein [Emticicia sp. BO119]MBA4852549.1 LytTR family transcriptional regulator [Emticicia sp. BO119]